MMKHLVFGVALSALVMSTASAQTKYNTWSDPNSPQAQAQSGAEMDKMINELRTLVTEAEKARAADPNFLQDLKDLAARYEGSFQALLFKDDFVDGNFTANPAWKLVSGKYWVERGYGLRSFVEPGGTTTSQPSQERKVSKEELIIGVLGAVLGGKVEQQGQPQQQATTTKVEPAEIYLASKINNAFTVKMDLSSWKNTGRFEIGTYQGTNRNTGYRLVYTPGQSPALQLVRHYSSNSAVVGTVSSLKLEDQKNHELVWSRTKFGETKVTVDGKVLINTTDQSFRDDFSGLVLKNSGGDYIIKSISVFGS